MLFWWCLSMGATTMSRLQLPDLYVGDQAVGAVGQWMADYHGKILGRKPRGSVGQEGRIKDSEQTRSPDVKTKGEGK